MTIRFACASCGQKLSVPDEKAGVAARCPKCRQPLVVPASSPDAPAASAVDAVIASVAPSLPPVPPIPPAPPPRPAPQRPPPPPAGPVASIPRVATAPPVPAASTPASAKPLSVKPEPAKPEPAKTEPAKTASPKPEAVKLATPPTATPPTAAPSTAAAPTAFAPARVEEAPADEDDVPPELAWMYEGREAPRSVVRTGESPEGPRVAAGLVVAQGLLLVVMLAVGFGLGRASQRAGDGGAQETLAARPATLSGKVEYGTSGGTSFPDEGAVVLVFPASQRPAADERIAYEGLRPTDLPLDANHESLEKLRLLGGGLARVDAAGQFRISLPKSGSYYVLVLSHHGARRANVAPNKSDLAQIGRYVQMANELIGDRRYRWTTEEITGQKRLDSALPH